MRLPVGESDFEAVIEGRFDFVDKSLFIKEIIDDDQIILITRPRRFGKTLNLSMLQYFFIVAAESKSTAALFNQLAINQESTEYSQHQGKYPVISFSFKDIKEKSFLNAYAGIANIIAELYREHHYLLTSRALLESERAVYESILQQTATPTNLKSSLKKLVTYLYRHHDKKVVVLIDEYDTPIQSGYLCDYYEDVIDFFHAFFGAALKDNKHIFKAVLTGILRVSRESLFSGLNNIVTYSMLDEKYGAYFGFTEQETQNLLEKANIADDFVEVKHWYNGYKVGNHTLYNPWSMANYIKEKKLKPYWVNTSDNLLIKELLLHSSDVFRNQFEPLLKGEPIDHLINEHFAFPELEVNRETALWSFLFMAGYLKVIGCEQTNRGPRCQLAIPNKEISDLYRAIIEEGLAGSKGLVWYDNFLAALLAGDIGVFKQGLEYLMDHTVSSHDTGRDPEAFYHGLVIGLTASLCDSETYELRSNRESGDGRYDYFIVSRDPKKLSILMEFKQAKLTALETAAQSALQQINVKHYLAEAEQRQITKILKIGLAFNGRKFALCAE